MFTLINSFNLRIELDPVETEDKYRPAVAFNITTLYTTTFQTTKIEIKRCWIEYFELSQFQENLQSFIEKRIDVAELLDMGLEPVLQFGRENDFIHFKLKNEANFPMGKVTLKIEIENDELIEILERMKNWAKWW